MSDGFYFFRPIKGYCGKKTIKLSALARTMEHFLWEIIPDLVKVATCTKEFVMLWNKSHLLYLCPGGIRIMRKKGCVCTLICMKGQYK